MAPATRSIGAMKGAARPRASLVLATVLDAAAVELVLVLAEEEAIAWLVQLILINSLVETYSCYQWW
jgi:hypothetical protein